MTNTALKVRQAVDQMTKDLQPSQILDFLAGAHQMLAKIQTPAEAGQFVKQADAVAYLTRKAKASLQVQQQAGKVAILAKQRAGELLAKTEISKGVRMAGKDPDGQVRLSHRGNADLPTLVDLGIDRHDSSTWQALAGVPQKQLEQHINQVIEEGGEPTTNDALRFVRSQTHPEPAETVTGSERGKQATRPLQTLRGALSQCHTALDDFYPQVTNLSRDERSTALMLLKILDKQLKRLRIVLSEANDKA